MECPVTTSLIGLIGVFVGVFFGNRLAIGRDNRMLRANFVSRICEFKSLADKIEDANFATWFAKMQVAVERECGLAQNAIRYRHRKNFTGLRGKISKIQRPDIEDCDNSKLAFPRAVMTYQTGRVLISEHLQNLIDFAD